MSMKCRFLELALVVFKAGVKLKGQNVILNISLVEIDSTTKLLGL